EDHWCANGLRAAAVISVLVFLQCAITRLAPGAAERKRPSPPSTAQPLRAASGQIVFGFWEKIADGRVAMTRRGPRDVRMVDGRSGRRAGGWSRLTSLLADALL